MRAARHRARHASDRRGLRPYGRSRPGAGDRNRHAGRRAGVPGRGGVVPRHRPRRDRTVRTRRNRDGKLMATLSVRRRAAAVLMAAAGALGVAGLCWPHTAAAQEPDVAAWWNAANLGDPAPAPPAPPDVNPGDLLVQGSNTVPTPGAPVTSAPGSAQAVAGLEFDLQSTDVVGALTLGIDGTAPPQ